MPHPAYVFRNIELLRAHAASSVSLSEISRAFGLEPSIQRNRIIRRLATEYKIDLSHIDAVDERQRRNVRGYSRFTREQLAEAAAKADSVTGVMRLLGMNSRASSCTAIRKRLVALGIDISHFKGSGWANGRVFSGRKPPEQILVVQTDKFRVVRSSTLRRAMIESGVPHQCNACELSPVWCGLKLVLQVDHRNGDVLNNLLTNLRFLCPNCHSQTANFGIKNMKKIRK